MSLIAVATLADYLGVDAAETGLQAYLDRAESFTATLLGASELGARTVSERVSVDLASSHSGLSGGAVDANVFYFSDGPVNSVSSAVLNGVNITSSISLDSRGWSFTYPIVMRSFSFDPAFFDPGIWRDRYVMTLEVEYEAGWADEASLPKAVKQFILMTAQKYYSLPVDGVYMVRIGDNYVTLDKDMFEAEYRRNEGLVNRFKRGFV